MVSRILYCGQAVQITPASSVGNTTNIWLPVSSASCEVTQPVEAVTSFGHLNALAVSQVNLTTCKATIKAYLQNGVYDYTSGSVTGATGVTASALAALTGDAVNGTLTQLNVYPYGFVMSGILSSLGIDVAMGGYATADLSFNGVGIPLFSGMPASSASPDQNVMPNAISPVTTVNVSGGIITGCATSFKFSLDMPTDNLACLGYDPNEQQGPNQHSMISTKPPYKSSMSVEGFGVDITNGGTLTQVMTGLYWVGPLSLQLPSPKVASRSFNQAVGTAGATYNYSLESVGVVFGGL